MAADCIFCKIIDGKIPAKKLAENEGAIAIADIQPQAPLHALVIPKRHVVGLSAMTADDRRELMPALYDLADQLVREKGAHDKGFRTVINDGHDGGQTVFHLHMHVLGGASLRHGFGS